MRKMMYIGIVFGLLVTTCISGEMKLIDFSSPDIRKQVVPSYGSNVKLDFGAEGVTVNVAKGHKGYPGINIQREGEGWDCSKYGRLAFDVTNRGDSKIFIKMRVDNPNGWQTKRFLSAHQEVAPGETRTVELTFGYDGHRPSTKLDPSDIALIIIFTSSAKTDLKYTVSNIRACDEPGVKPRDFREKVRPYDGKIIDFAGGFDGEIQDIDARSMVTDSGAGITFLSEGKHRAPGVVFKPKKSVIWDLSQFNKVCVHLENPGAEAITVVAQLKNRKRVKYSPNSPAVSVRLKPGEEKIAEIPFIRPDLIWDGNNPKGSGFHFDSSDVVGVSVFSDDKDSAAGKRIILKRVYAVAAKGPAMPVWLGKRPPVPGNWKVTFEDDFNGSNIDTNKWLLPNRTKETSEHPMDIDGARSWWGIDNSISSKNVYIEDGKMIIKCELTEDSPANKNIKTRYVTGVARTFGRFAQKYGYFESRIKVPDVYGMWPAFWMLPDRGTDAGIWWKRSSTSDGGMEFDIMEHMGRYGPYRTNIAFHWDGYKENHKSVGTENIYFYVDDEGFMTAGMLWEPGKVTYYANGTPVAVFESDRIGSVPGHIIYTMPVGGWGGNDINEKLLPAQFEIDYVRVWQNDDFR